MAHEFKLPDVGEGVAEGEIVAWLVSAGDAVNEDQPVAEVETDKALVEVPSPVTGTVRELRADEGDVVPVGDVFITFDVEGDDPAETPAEATETADEDEPADGDDDDRTFAAPSVRRLARELDVDLVSVDGSGPGGRITEADVEGAADGAPADAESVGSTEPAAVDAEATGEPAGRERTLAAPATRQLARDLGVDIDAVPATEERDGEAFVTADAVKAFAESGGEAAADADEAVPRGGERVPYRGLRRTIGEQMERSAFTIPHVTHQELLDATGLVEARTSLKPHAEERGIRLTYLPFIIRAVIAALAEHPYLNATLDEEAGEIVLKDDYNIGFAVATDAGLFVPVVKEAETKGLLQIASEIAELADKARDRSIAREEMQDGTFTITNYGSVGGDYGTPIINHPEVAILGLGAIEKRPAVDDGEVVARETLPISLSIDHRIIDGAEAGRFVATFAKYIETPALLLLD